MASAAKGVAVLVGSSQGIGLELARIYLSQTNLHIVALSRNAKAAREAILDSSPKTPFIVQKDASVGHTSDSAFKIFESKGFDQDRLTTIDTDVKDEDSIHKASEKVKSEFGKDSIRLIFNVAGMLHPEKSLAQVEYGEMLAQFQLNTFAPLLVMKHFSPLLTSAKTLQSLQDDSSNGLLPTHNNVITSLSARVGSISDNRLGGWYSYRASKAALNQITRSVSNDLTRKQVPAICVNLHPGTVRTQLSKEFTGGPGGGDKGDKKSAEERRKKGEFEAPESASLLSGVVSRLKDEDSGFVWDYSGAKIPF